MAQPVVTASLCDRFQQIGLDVPTMVDGGRFPSEEILRVEEVAREAFSQISPFVSQTITRRNRSVLQLLQIEQMQKGLVIDSIVFQELQEWIRVHSNAEVKTDEWVFPMKRMESLLIDEIRSRVTQRFPTISMTTISVKVHEKFAQEILLLREKQLSDMERVLKKNLSLYFEAILKGRIHPQDRYSAKGQFQEVFCKKYRELCPQWIIDDQDLRGRSQQYFDAFWEKYCTQSIAFLEESVSLQLRRFYEKQDDSFDKGLPVEEFSFEVFSQEMRRVVQESFRACFLSEWIFQNVLRKIIKEVSEERPFEYIFRLVEKHYFEFEKRHQNVDEVGALCEDIFFRRFPTFDRTRCKEHISLYLLRLKRERQLPVRLKDFIVEYLESSQRKDQFRKELDMFFREAFPGVTWPEKNLFNRSLSIYIEIKAHEWNTKMRSTFAGTIAYPFVFPDKQEPLHQKAYAQFLDSLARDLSSDFEIPLLAEPQFEARLERKMRGEITEDVSQKPFQPELEAQFEKMAHDALNECIREAARIVPIPTG